MPKDSVQGNIEPDYPFLLGLYQELHAHPELSGQEEWTSDRIASELAAAGVIILLFFVRLDPLYEGIVLFTVLCMLMIALLLLIKDMDNPFEIGTHTYADVDLETLKYLETYFDEQDAAEAAR